MKKTKEAFLNRFFRFPVLIVLVIAVITVFFALQLPKAKLDNNNFRFVPENDEARLTSRYIDDTFGSSFFVLVGLERRDGDIFDPAFLMKIKEYVDRISEISIVGEINSITSADYISGDSYSVSVEKLVGDDFSGGAEEITALKRKLLSWDLYRNALVSEDFRATQILVPLEIETEDVGKSEVIEEYILVRDYAREMFAGIADVYVTGLPIISATVSEAMKKDLAALIPLVVALVLVILILSFRRLTAVLLPLLTVVVAAIWSVGAMPLFGIQLTILSTVLPVILVAVGSAYGIHIVTHYLEDIKNKDEINSGEYREIIFALVRRIAKPVFLAALTTFAGFVSFCFTSVLPIREWGFFASFGVVVSFVVAVTLIPAILIMTGPPSSSGKSALLRARGKSKNAAGFNLSYALFTISQKKKLILCITGIIALFAVIGASRVVIDNVFVEYFKASSDIARSDRFIREKFGGSKVVSLVIAADDSETVLHPDTLFAMDGLASYLMSDVKETGKTLGFTDLVKRINQVFNAGENPEGIAAPVQNPLEENESAEFGFGDFGFGDLDSSNSESSAYIDGFDETFPAEETPDRFGKSLTYGELLSVFEDTLFSSGYEMSAESFFTSLKKRLNYEGAAYYEIPRDPRRYGKSSPEELQRLVSNYLILLSGNIDAYANDPLEPTAIKMSIQLRTLGEEDTGKVIDVMNNYIANKFPKNIRVIVGGPAFIESSLNRLVVQSQLISVAISLLVVFIIISVSNRSIAAGCIGAIPLAFAILINFAVMGFLKIKLNIGTSMVASLSVGIGIDYTIHFIESYKTEFRASGGKDYLLRAFATAGRAIVINAVSVGAGFAVLIFSQFVILREFGLLIALTMAVSALVSLTVIPALLGIFKPRFIGGRS